MDIALIINMTPAEEHNGVETQYVIAN